MLGFGAEYALDGNWSIKGEYDYFHAGSRNLRFVGSQTIGAVTTPVAADLQIEQALHVVKLGVNYRFGGIAVDPAYAPVRAAPVTGPVPISACRAAMALATRNGPVSPIRSIRQGEVQRGRLARLAGGTGGVNVQSGVFVFGVEGEWMWTGIKGGQAFTDALVVVRRRRLRSKPASTGLPSPARVPASSSATSCCSTAKAASRSRKNEFAPGSDHPPCR